MNAKELAGYLTKVGQNTENRFDQMNVSGVGTVSIYPNSIHEYQDVIVFIGWHGTSKSLWALTTASKIPQLLGEATSLGDGNLMRCPLSHENAVVIREWFDFTRPVLLGIEDSFGYGDRLGIANPAHVRAAVQYNMRPIFAQQSIRELTRTERQADEVLDAATWAVLQEGYKNGFGADADHLKTTEDVDRMVDAGFTFFTIDPGDYVVNEADNLPAESLAEKAAALEWQELADSVDDLVARYENHSIEITDEFTLEPDCGQVLRAIIKYCGVAVHTARLYWHLKTTYPVYAAEFELSVDETESVTSPFEHYFVANELNRLGVRLVSLAPRFVGEFEKGIDYKGDLDLFKTEYLKHVQIARKLGPYKISFHSGSDKFTVYEAIGSLRQGNVHVKTAGTSYLEALRTVAQCEPSLFRKILDFACSRYQAEKQTYHVSAQLKNVAAAGDCTEADLVALFDQDDARQVLHVTFGKVLTARSTSGDFLFKDSIIQCLQENEDIHYAKLIRHFRRHLEPFA